MGQSPSRSDEGNADQRRRRRLSVPFRTPFSPQNRTQATAESAATPSRPGNSVTNLLYRSRSLRRLTNVPQPQTPDRSQRPAIPVSREHSPLSRGLSRFLSRSGSHERSSGRNRPYTIEEHTDDEPSASAIGSTPSLPQLVDGPFDDQRQNTLQPDMASYESTGFSRSRTTRTPSPMPSRSQYRSSEHHGFRRMAPPWRRRRAPRAEDQAAMLARLLSMAAAATAATLTGGNPETAMSDLRNATGGFEGDDGTFNGFLQALRSGRLVSALAQHDRPTSSEDADADATDRPPTLEFFRMFRFGAPSTTQQPSRSPSPTRPTSSRSVLRRQTSSPDSEEDGQPPYRMVPILIVGIRALTGERAGQGPEEAVPSFLDALTTAPSTVSLGLSDETIADTLRRQPASSFTSSQRRRASMGAFNIFNRDNRRRSRSPTPVPVPTHSPETFGSPSGPEAPPTTPASAPLSAMASGATTPTSRSRSSSNTATAQSRRESLIRRVTGTTLEPTAEETTGTTRPQRRRRMSESDTPRFGSGNPRRNGVLMEPDDSQTEGNTRSWIIYILGGSYPEDHPILSTPSLFTDSPTYEDMLLLSSLLGPAKPPVASAEDVASAPGILRVTETEKGLIAMGSGEEDAPIAPEERCLVCLCAYEEGEVARRLVKCQHMFHKDCIDQWLTTGQNSCPLCRGEGVIESGEEGTEAGMASS